MSEPPPAYNALDNSHVPSETEKRDSVPAVPESVPKLSYGSPGCPTSPPVQTGTPAYAGNPIVVATIAFVENPMSIICPHCHHQILTKTSPKNGLLTWLLCGGLALFGCWLCCCIPFCVDSCQDIEHHCPNCGILLGTYRRI